MNFGAGAAGAGFAHHPEIVLFAAKDDVDFGVQTGGGEFGGRYLVCFVV
jgi:hypothetical protein